MAKRSRSRSRSRDRSKSKKRKRHRSESKKKRAKDKKYRKYSTEEKSQVDRKHRKETKRRQRCADGEVPCKTQAPRSPVKRSSSSSSSTSTSSSSSSSSSSRERRREKKRKKRKKEKKKQKLKEKKHIGPSMSMTDAASTSGMIADEKPVDPKVKAMRPMTKDEWDKQQSVVRKVYDPETGRERLVKGRGEILEEIVSKDRQREINKQATKGDGLYYAAKLGIQDK